MFYNNFKVPELLEGEVKEEPCSADAENSECSDAYSEEQDNQAGCEQHAADPDLDRKVSHDLTPLDVGLSDISGASACSFYN